MKQKSSSRRVNEQAREVIATILLFEMTDPRLDMVTITGCEVSFDRSVANVYFTSDKDRYVEVAQALQVASGRIRSLMAKQLSWRVAPELRFMLDPSVDEAERIASALARERERGEADGVDVSAANRPDEARAGTESTAEHPVSAREASAGE